MIDLTGFKAKYKDGARANLFQVTFAGIQEEIQIYCKSVQMGGIDIGVIDKRYQANPLKFKGDRVYPELSMTLELDESDTLYVQLQIFALSSLKSILTVDQLSREDGSIILTSAYESAWISSISPIELAQDSTDTITEYTITVQYDSSIVA